jgi:HEPN domain-containing protein
MKLKNKRLAQEWFDRAKSDYLYAQAGEKETGQHHITCFLCHQAVEKILKGFLAGSGIAPQKTHSLRLLLTQVKEHFPDLAFEESDARKLDTFYIPSRYPGPVISEFRPKDAHTALEVEERFLKIVSS